MSLSGRLVFIAFAFVAAPCFAQDGRNEQTTPAVTGSGQANHVAVWESTTRLGPSVIVATGGNVGIGTTAPAAKLEVAGDAQVDGDFSLSGSILSNGAGPVIQAPNNGSNNFAAGLGALAPGTTGGQNTAVGDNSLHVNSLGVYNTAIGYQSLWSNTWGGGNAAVGGLSLESNTLGNNNAAFGEFALGSNTTGSDNTGIGSGSLAANTTGNDNTAVGGGAMALNNSGAFNTAIGPNALLNNTSGSYNVAIGYLAGENVFTTGNNLHIANVGLSSDSGVVRIGTAGKQVSAFIAGIYGTMTGLADVPVVVDTNGQLGTVSSSRRYKEDIRDMGSESNSLMRLRPVTFRYKKALDDGSKPVQYGLIAEEVAEVYPDLVARSADGQIETVKYQLLDSMLLNELQKQNATITAQNEQIRSLEGRLARVEAALGGTAVTTSSH